MLNIGLDLACIILFNMGVFGAAFATVFSQAVAGIGSLIYIMRHYPELRWNKEEGRISAPHCAKLCAMGLPMGLQCSITAIGSVVLQGAVNGLGSDIVAAQTAGGKAAQFLSVPLESIGTAMTTYTSQNMGAKDLGRVNRGVNTALGIGCVYSVASFLILRVLDKPLIGLFLDAGETAIMANAQEFIFWNSVFYIPLAVLIIYRYTIQGLGHSGLAMFAEVEDMAFDSIIPAVTSGKADVGLAGMTASEDRKVSVDFSDTYVEAGQVIIVKKGSDIKDASGLTGKTVGVQLGTTGDLYVSDPKNVENVTVQQFPKGADAVEALKTDKIDAVVIDNQPAKKFVENNSDIEILATPLTQESYAIAVAKDNKQLLDAVNKALAELKESGELDPILNKYLASDESAETTTSAQ